MIHTLGVSQCIGTDHDNNIISSWKSCSPVANPNPSYSDGHWILYDLGEVYNINGSHIWNF